MNSEQIAQARVLARLLPVAEQREVVEALLDEIERLRAERDRLRELIRHMDIEHDAGWWSRDVRERIAAALEDKTLASIRQDRGRRVDRTAHITM